MPARVSDSSGYLEAGQGRVENKSDLKRDFYTLISARPDFHRFTWNPIELEYTDSWGKRRTYTPDALVEFRVGSDMPAFLLFELKYRAELRSSIDELRDRYYAAREYVSQFGGWSFQVRTEASVCKVLVSNTVFLSRYRSIPLEDQDPDHPRLLLDELRARGRATPELLLTVCYGNFEDKARALPYLWAMIAQRIVMCDLRSPLNMQSLLWLNY